MTAPPYTREDDATILRLRAEGWRWVLIALAIGKGHTPSGVDRHWQNLMRDARIAAAEAADAARPKVLMVVPGTRPPPPVPSPQIKSYWPDGWTITPPTQPKGMRRK